MSRTMQLRLERLPPLAIFAMLAAAVVGLGITALERSDGAALVVTAVTIDLVLVIPGVHYLLIVRGLGLPAISVLPVFRLSLAVASIVLPADDRALYDLIAPVGRVAEVAMGAFVLYRFRLGWRAFRSATETDRLNRYRIGTRAALPPSIPSVERAVDAVAFEAALVSYGTGAFRSRPEFPADATPFTGHRKAAYGSIAAALLIVLVIEMVAVHLLVSLWSGTIAWILTGLTAYAMIWIVGDVQAMRLRPSWVNEQEACFRLGLRWTLTVPRRHIRQARKLAAGERIEGALPLCLPNAPRVLIELSTPVVATGVYGVQRTATAIELGSDDPDALLRCLTHEAGAAARDSAPGGT